MNATLLAGVVSVVKCFGCALDPLNEVKKEPGDGKMTLKVHIFGLSNHTHFKVKMQYQLVLSGLKSYFVGESLVSVAKAIVELATISAQLSDEYASAFAVQDIVRRCNLP